MSAAAPSAEAGGGVRTAAEQGVWDLLSGVPDPEIPVLSIVDLGIVRYVRSGPDRRLHIGITPTYSGCPATEAIRAATRAALDAAGYREACLEEVLSPPWTSDWVTPAGRAKLAAFGIAPPPSAADAGRRASAPVGCPRCGSLATERISEFGSTPCKAHYRCNSCHEPFDHFKCI
ncbi:MAG TPA: 1,2-phenylacetyl-CoA epoxidase subunit PaaD [Steroidobacteraceae bacterium]|nr:1,2-phenylacetyl-CoA epoxidase subunit PaaD [Steroidobacteraceae bacterium]